MKKRQKVFRTLLKKVRLRTWISVGLITLISPLILFGMLKVAFVIGALGGSNATAIAIWHLDESNANTCSNGSNDACDASGNGNDGAYGATTATPTIEDENSCVSGKCLYFDGSDDTVTVSNTINGVKSVSFWVRPITTTEQYISLTSSAYITTSGGTLSATGFTSPTYYINGVATSSPVVASNKWTHVVVTTGTAINANAITLGNQSTNYGNEYLDEIKFFTSELSAAQVKSEYSGGAAVFSGEPGSNNFLSHGLVGYWKMDESSGNATDSSGNGNTLTNNNTTPFSIGKFGNAPTFNGSNRYFSTSTSAGSVQTVSFWIHPASTTDNFINLASGVYISSSSGTVSCTGCSGTTTIYVNGVNSTTISSGVWQLITVVSNSGTTADTVNIGRANGSVAASSSQIDEIRLYNRALTPSEVTALYNWAPGPIGYWNLDENTGTTAYDSSSNGNTGSLNNGPIWKQGKFSSGVYFDGANDEIDVGSATILDNLPVLTASAWIYPTTTGESGFGRVFDKTSGTAPAGGWFFGLTDTPASQRLRFAVAYDSLSKICNSTDSGVITLNTWQYVTVTWDGSSGCTGVNMYVNGSSIGVTTGQNNSGARSSDASQNLRLGNDSTQARTFNGIIDDAKLFNYIRTPQQIVEDMNGGHPTGGSPIGTESVYWKFDEMNGTTAYDTANTTSSNGTLTNMATSPSTTSSGWNASGKVNSALTFDGSDDQVTIATASDSEVDYNTSEAFSLCSWIYPTTMPGASDEDLIVGKWDATSNLRAYRMYLTDSNANSLANLNAQIYDESADQVITASTTSEPLATNTWYHVCMTFDGGQTGAANDLNIYINGINVGSNSANGSFAGLEDVAADFTVGDYDATDVTSADTAFTGKIDELEVFSSELTSSQVRVVMNANALENFGSTAATSEAAQLTDGAGNPPVTYLNFNENSGTTAYDRSGYGRNAALTVGGGGGISTFRPGKIGSGVYLSPNNIVDTSNYTGYVAFSTELMDSLTEGTIEFWMKADNNTEDDFQQLFYVGDTSAGVTTAMELGYNTSSSKIHLYFVQAGSLKIEATSTALSSPTDWHHIVYTSSSAGNRIYIDGVLNTLTYTTGTTSTQFFFNNVSSGTTYYKIGCTVNGPTSCEQTENYWGMIDEFKVYDYARTQSQVSYDYNRGRPTGWWKMDENVSGNNQTLYDLSGKGHNGTTHYGANTTGMNCTVAGKFNYGCDFDGTDDYVSVATPSLPTGDFTYSMWVNLDAVNDETLVMSADGAGGDEFFIRVDTSGTRLYVVVNNADAITGTFSPALSTGVWYHIAVVRSGSNLTAYLNGNAVSTGTGGSTLNFSTCDLLIGTDADSSCTGSLGNYTDGRIDDLRVYNYALSAIQIKKLISDDAGAFFGPASGTP